MHSIYVQRPARRAGGGRPKVLSGPVEHTLDCRGLSTSCGQRHARTHARTSGANRQNEQRSNKRHEGARGQREAAPTWRGRWPRRLYMTIGAEAGGSGFIS